MGSSTGAVKQETFNSSLRIMEQSSWVRFEEEESPLETSRRRSKNISTSSSLSFPLFHRVDVNGETNGRLHSSSGRGTVLSAPERQIRRPAGPARHLRQPGLEQPHPERDPGGRHRSKTVNFFCDDSS